MASETNEPMGGNVPEEKFGQAEHLGNRNVWAIDTLIEEITAVLGETVTETSKPNWLNANTVVTFMPDPEDWEDFAALMEGLRDDERIADVTTSAVEATITVTVVNNAILYDTRDSFGLFDAAVGLDRAITPDDLTPFATDVLSGGEGFVEGSL